jgi:hypothetical protein
LRDEDRKIKRALSLLTSEKAEAIVGEDAPEDLQTLLDGVQAAQGVLWAGMKSHGARQNRASLRMISQNLMVLQTMVLYGYALGKGYALGIRRGESDCDS